MTTPTPPSGDTKPYEERDVSLRPIVVTAIILVAVLIATFGIMRILDTALRGREAARSAPASPLAGSYARQEPPAPRLQESPRGDLAALRAREAALLEGYGWVDRRSGRVRIPVERAMALLLAENER
jgi:hypothetical protein